MSYTLIISEKPNAATKIAQALADDQPKKVAAGGAYWFELKRGDREIKVAPAVGHLFGLKQVTGNSDYPALEIAWQPSWEVNKESDYAKKYFDNIKKLSEKADDFVVATDFDVEGSLIGFNILRFAHCDESKATRMKFSTLTKEELIDAFEKKSGLDYSNIWAGEARHKLDWFWGINISRALMSAVRRAGAFRVLSIGRVQGPALALLAEREKKIASFVSTPYWQLVALYEGVEFLHRKQRFENEREADEALARSEKSGFVSLLDKKKMKLRPLPPFDLTTLQTEAYRCFSINPARTMQIAQGLYEAALISYPRSASQKLPPQLNLKKIISQLAANPVYEEKAKALLAAERVKPAEGEKVDPAHPAVHPTGLKPSAGALKGEAAKVYDLIVRRFLQCFAEDAEAERVGAELTLGREKYFAQGDRVTKRGWMGFYEPYTKFEEKQMPELRLNQKLTVDEIKKVKKMTQPPKRFTPASIVSELEERDLGTKATRAEIIETLYRRGYVEGKSIAVTALGLAVADSLEKHVPEIMSDELTRHFEKEMDEIQEGKTTQEKVVAEGKREIAKICDEFRPQEEAIGRELLGAVNEMQRKASVLGKCNKCGKGEIVVRRGKFGLFAACNAYPECKNTFPLPKDAAVLATGKTCTFCSLPIVKIVRRGRRPFEMCLTPNCESKANWGNKRYAKKEEAQETKQPTQEVKPLPQKVTATAQNVKPEGKLEGKPRKAPKASKKKAGKEKKTGKKEEKQKEKKENEGVADAAA